MENFSKTVGFIGLGIMGKPMARNLIKEGYKLLVHDINREPVAELEKEGAAAASDSMEVARQCSTIITMLPDSPDSKKVIIGEEGIIKTAKKGALVIDMSSIDPIVSMEIARELAVKDIEFLDAPVSGGEPKAVSGDLAIMVGGKEEIYRKAVPLFEVMGGSHTFIGEAGAGNWTKLSNQIIVAVNIAAVGEALVLAKKAGLSPEAVYKAIRGGLAGSTVLDNKAPMIISRDFKPGFKIDLHKKDLQNVLKAGSALDVPLPLSALMLEILKSLVSAGDGGLDHGAIARFFERIAGVEVKE